MVRGACASIQSVPDPRGLKARKQWEKVLSNLLRRPRQVVRRQPTRLEKPSFSSRPIVRVSFMGQTLLSMAAEPPFENAAENPQSATSDQMRFVCPCLRLTAF